MMCPYCRQPMDSADHKTRVRYTKDGVILQCVVYRIVVNRKKLGTISSDGTFRVAQ